MNTRAGSALSVVAVGLSITLAASLAVADIPADDIDIDLFKPIVTRRGAAHARGGVGLEGGTYAWGLWFQYAHNPLVWRAASGQTLPAVQGQLFGVAALAYAPWSLLELQAVVPWLLFQRTPENTGLGRLGVAALGDIRLVARIPVELGEALPALAFGLDLALPTGSGSALVGATGPVLWPSLGLTVPLAGFDLVGDFGYKLRRRAELATLMIDDELTMSLGLRWPFMAGLRQVVLAASLYGQGRLDGFSEFGAATGLEALGMADVEVATGVWLQVGLGVGLSRGYGTPDFRIVMGVLHRADEPIKVAPLLHPCPPPPDYTGEIDWERCADYWPEPDDSLEPSEPEEPLAPFSFEIEPIEEPVPVEPPEAEVTTEQIVIHGQVLFDLGRATIASGSLSLLDKVARQIVEHPQIRLVRIEGHTDSQGPADFNLRLSQQRAESVRRYLIEQGVEPERLRAVGYGEERPIASNQTERGRAMNRRVEFHIEEWDASW